jgi:hypothetical protein
MTDVRNIIQGLVDDTVSLLSLDMKKMVEVKNPERTQFLYDDLLQSFLSNLIAINDAGYMDNYVEVLKEIEKDATRSYMKQKAENKS